MSKKKKVVNDLNINIEAQVIAEDTKSVNRIALIILIGIMLILSIAIPFIMQWGIVGNGVISAWKEEVWGGFLGSLWGGIIGGVGTLCAVLFTTNQTRKFQIRNELNREKDKNAADKLRAEDKEEEARKERKVFANSIIEAMGVYNTHINVYFYNTFVNERNNKDIEILKDELRKVEREIETVRNEPCSTHVDDITIDDYKYRLVKKKEKLEKDLQNKIDDNEKHIVDRTKANEYYFTLRMKLYDIPEANDLVNHLLYVHNNLFNKPIDELYNATEKLIELTELFVVLYV